MPQPQQPQTKRQNPNANRAPAVPPPMSAQRPTALSATSPTPAAHQAPPPSKWDLLTTQFGKAVGSPGVTYALQHPVQAIEDKVKDLPAVAKSLPGKVSALREAIDNIPSNIIKGSPGAYRNLVAHAKEAKNQWQHGDHGAAATTLLQGAPLVGNTLGHLSDATQAAYQDSKERVKEANDMRKQGLYGGAAVNMLEATPLLGGYIEHQMDNYDSRDTAGNNAARLGGYLGGTLTNMWAPEAGGAVLKPLAPLLSEALATRAGGLVDRAAGYGADEAAVGAGGMTPGRAYLEGGGGPAFRSTLEGQARAVGDRVGQGFDHSYEATPEVLDPSHQRLFDTAYGAGQLADRAATTAAAAPSLATTMGQTGLKIMKDTIKDRNPFKAVMSAASDSVPGMTTKGYGLFKAAQAVPYIPKVLPYAGLVSPLLQGMPQYQQDPNQK